MIKLSSQNGNFNLSAPYLDITEVLEHQKTTYSFYVCTELIRAFGAEAQAHALAHATVYLSASRRFTKLTGARSTIARP